MKVQSFRKYWCIFVFLALMLGIPGQVFAQAAQQPNSQIIALLSDNSAVQDPVEPIGVVSTGALNVRSGPGVNATKVTVIYKGQVVALLGRWATNNWVMVRLYSGVEGWVNSIYLTTNVPINELPVLGGQPPTIEPTPPESQATAIVTTGVLNVRKGPSISYSIVDVVKQGDRLVLIGRNQNGSWVKVNTPSNVEGWVNASLIQPSKTIDSLPIIESSETTPAAIVTTGAVNVRSGPGGQYSVLTVLFKGQTVALIGRTNNSAWLKIRFNNNQEGWVNASTVQSNVSVQSLPVAEIPPPPNPAVVNVSWLNVRSGPGTNFNAFTILNRGQVVSMASRAANSTWVQIYLPSGNTGWVNSNYLLGNTPINELPVIFP